MLKKQAAAAKMEMYNAFIQFCPAELFAEFVFPASGRWGSKTTRFYKN